MSLYTFDGDEKNLNPKPESSSLSASKADVNLNICFPISEAGETNRKRAHQRIINYKSPIPKTKLTRALLGDNVCDERKLQLDINKLSSNQRRLELLRNRNQLTFAQTQERKRTMWKKDDEHQLQRLNLPQLHPGSRALLSASLTKVYQAPQNHGAPVFSVPLLPVMVGDDERRIVEHDRQIFLTRLPTIIKLSTPQKTRYHRYKGTKLLESRTVQDERFKMLYNTLSERKSASRPKKKRFYFTRASTVL